MDVHEYDGVRRVTYEGGAQFVPVCKRCGRFVVADDSIMSNGAGVKNEPNSTCRRCERTYMVFEGFVG
ncbi:MAG: hypothetical protein Q8R92_01710 [Deltaproteobacteria bacterium]|nr:hypothetical protein [Deltaproteobacteria bacterium]